MAAAWLLIDTNRVPFTDLCSTATAGDDRDAERTMDAVFGQFPALSQVSFYAGRPLILCHCASDMHRRKRTLLVHCCQSHKVSFVTALRVAAGSRIASNCYCVDKMITPIIARALSHLPFVEHSVDVIRGIALRYALIALDFRSLADSNYLCHRQRLPRTCPWASTCTHCN